MFCVASFQRSCFVFALTEKRCRRWFWCSPSSWFSSRVWCLCLLPWPQEACQRQSLLAILVHSMIHTSEYWSPSDLLTSFFSSMKATASHAAQTSQTQMSCKLSETAWMLSSGTSSHSSRTLSQVSLFSALNHESSSSKTKCHWWRDWGLFMSHRWHRWPSRQPLSDGTASHGLCRVDSQGGMTWHADDIYGH